MAPSRDIILYQYTFSPYAKRVVWYLNLRKIAYTQCLQPPIMPRPDVRALGVEYRRIPVLAIGRDIYNDTRLIIRKLEAIFPPSSENPSISASSPDGEAIERLLEFWAIDSGIFTRAAQLIPSSLPLLKDEQFTKDREQYNGRPWNKVAMETMRPEALVEIKGAFEFLESTLLADGREWVLRTDGPSLADIEAVWPYHWLQTLKGALPPEVVSPRHFPKVFAWVNRFEAATRTAAKALGKPETVRGDQAAARIGAAQFVEERGDVDQSDPTGLRAGDDVEVWPIDTGFNNKDRGKLVGLNTQEIVIEAKTQKEEVVRIHSPRHGFRVRAVSRAKSSL